MSISRFFGGSSGKVFRLKFLHVNYLSADKSNNWLSIKQRQKLKLAYDCFRTVTCATCKPIYNTVEDGVT